MNHIHLSSIDCDNLQWVEKGQTYVCLGLCEDLSDSELCMTCKNAKLKIRDSALYNAIRRRRYQRGGIL